MNNTILVILHKTGQSFAYYDVQTGKTLRSIDTKPFPHEICLSPDRKSFYVAEMGVRGVESTGPGGHTIAIYRTGTGEKTGEIDTGKYDRPHGLVTHANGRLYVTSESTQYLLIYDLNKNELIQKVYLGQKCAHMVNTSHNGNRAYTANIFSNTITEIDTTDGRVIRHITVPERPEGMVCAPDDSLIYVVCREAKRIAVIDAAHGEWIDSIPTGNGPVRIAMTPDGSQFVIPLFHSAAVQVIDRVTKVTQTLDVGPHPAGVAISPDGGLFFISCEDEQQVYVFDMHTKELLNKIKTGPGCDAMVCLDRREIKFFDIWS